VVLETFDAGLAVLETFGGGLVVLRTLGDGVVGSLRMAAAEYERERAM